MKKGVIKKLLLSMMIVSLTVSSVPATVFAEAASVEDIVTGEDQKEIYSEQTTLSDYNETNAAFLAFTDEGITGSGLSEGYSVSGTDLTVSANGVYVLSGSCSNGSGSDNSALDWDGSCTISGGTVFAAGSRQMAGTPSTSGTQKCITISGTTRNKDTGKTVPKIGSKAFKGIYKKAIIKVPKKAKKKYVKALSKKSVGYVSGWKIK